MGSEIVVREMLGKRAELAERLETLDGERQSILGDITALDRGIRVFDPSYSPAKAVDGSRGSKHKLKLVPFVRREMTTLIGQILRGADGPMSSADIAAALAERKGVTADDKDSRAWLANRVSIALHGLERIHVVLGLRPDGERAVRWQAAR